MKHDYNALLDEMAKRDKAFGAFYHSVAQGFGLSESALWVLYFLHVSADRVSQQDLVAAMALPKQTVNSAVLKLAGEGLVELVPIPHSRNRKEVALTDAGRRRVASTVEKLRDAELAAAESMGRERFELFIGLHDEFLQGIRNALDDREA